MPNLNDPNSMWYFPDDDEEDDLDLHTSLTVDTILKTPQLSSNKKPAVIRGRVPRKYTGDTHTISVKLKMADFQMMQQCCHEDIRFAHMYADFVRDAIMDRIDKHLTERDDPSYAISWREMQNVIRLKEEEARAMERVTVLQSLAQSTAAVRALGDDAAYQRMRQIAEEIYLTASPKVQETIKLAFPEIGG